MSGRRLRYPGPSSGLAAAEISNIVIRAHSMLQRAVRQLDKRPPGTNLVGALAKFLVGAYLTE